MWGIKTDHCQELSSRMKSFFLIEFKHKIDSFIEVKSWTLSEKKKSPTKAHTTNVAARGVLPSLTKVHRVVSLPIENRFQKPLSFLISFPSNTPKFQIWADPRFGMRTILKEHSEKKKEGKSRLESVWNLGVRSHWKMLIWFSSLARHSNSFECFCKKSSQHPTHSKEPKSRKWCCNHFQDPPNFWFLPLNSAKERKGFPAPLLTVKLSI